MKKNEEENKEITSEQQLKMLEERIEDFLIKVNRVNRVVSRVDQSISILLDALSRKGY